MDGAKLLVPGFAYREVDGIIRDIQVFSETHVSGTTYNTQSGPQTTISSTTETTQRVFLHVSDGREINFEVEKNVPLRVGNHILVQFVQSERGGETIGHLVNRDSGQKWTWHHEKHLPPHGLSLFVVPIAYIAVLYGLKAIGLHWDRNLPVTLAAIGIGLLVVGVLFWRGLRRQREAQREIDAELMAAPLRSGVPRAAPATRARTDAEATAASAKSLAGLRGVKVNIEPGRARPVERPARNWGRIALYGLIGLFVAGLSAAGTALYISGTDLMSRQAVPPLTADQQAAEARREAEDDARRLAARPFVDRFITDHFKLSFDNGRETFRSDTYRHLRAIAQRKGKAAEFDTFVTKQSGPWKGGPVASLGLSGVIHGVALATARQQIENFDVLVSALGGYDALTAELRASGDGGDKAVLAMLGKRGELENQLRSMGGEPDRNIAGTVTTLQALAPELATMLPRPGQIHSPDYARLMEIARRTGDTTTTSAVASLGTRLAAPLPNVPAEVKYELAERATMLTAAIQYMYQPHFANKPVAGSPDDRFLRALFERLKAECNSKLKTGSYTPCAYEIK